MAVLVDAPPCMVHEDEHLLVVNKPGGLNTHSPSPFAGEGLHEWLKHREPRWARLAIVHRLDKVTSGLMVFAKSKAANQSLTQQFATRVVDKRYLMLSHRRPKNAMMKVRTLISRLGDKYIAHPATGENAETEFEYVAESGGFHLVAAHPLTGRTHQIRVHAAHAGFPILGDGLYGGEDFPRVCLHAEKLSFEHPVLKERVSFHAQANFFADPATVLRQALIDARETNAFRISHGEGAPGVYVEKWGDYLLVEAETQPDPASKVQAKGAYFKRLDRQVQHSSKAEASPQHLWGEPAPEPFEILENGVRYEISFVRGYSVGLFLDQRENRRRLLANHIGADFPLPSDWLRGKEVLNTFAYTCGFSVCAALAGAQCTSLDLSKNYIEWGQRNFALNKIDPAAHDFIYGDVFDWVPRLHKKSRQFDLIIVDPPTFSRSKLGGVFQAERDLAKLVKLVLPLLRKGGVIFVSTNAHKLPPETFRAEVLKGVQAAHRKPTAEQYVPQPIDFPITRSEPAYLKTLWLRVE